MPWSSPSRPSRARRWGLDAVASTVAPARFASWIAAMPTPPAPAWTSTVSPAWRRPSSNRQSSAVPTGMGTQAAFSRPAPSGMIQVARASTARFSAWEPFIPTHTTRCPTSRSATPSPTSAITPAHWYPTMCGLAASSPRSRFSVSPPSMLIVRTSITTPPGPQTGSGTSA